MNWFNNLKISKKLIPAFIIIALLIVVVGSIGIRNMQTLKKNAQEMYNQNLVSIQKINKVKQDTLEIRYDLFGKLALEVIEEHINIQKIAKMGNKPLFNKYFSSTRASLRKYATRIIKGRSLFSFQESLSSKTISVPGNFS